MNFSVQYRDSQEYVALQMEIKWLLPTVAPPRLMRLPKLANTWYITRCVCAETWNTDSGNAIHEKLT
jgi:hypothetical protein